MYRPQPQDFPDSSHARELRGDIGALCFAPSIENEYHEAHLARVRHRLRLFFGLVAALAAAYAGARLWRDGWSNGATLFAMGALLAAAGALQWLAWSSHYRELYRPFGAWVGGVFHVALAMLIAQAVAGGKVEPLAVLAVDIVAIFFFSGLLFRPAVLTCAVSLLAFTVSGVVLDMPFAELSTCLAVTSMTAFIASAVYHDVEQSYRVSFLESTLIMLLVARDGLSGLMNRAAFEDHLDRVWKHALRDRRSLTVFMLDLDGLEGFNAEHGKEAGDGALRSIAREIQEFGRRPLDLAARYDGARFALVLYDLAGGHVSDMAERLRRRIAQMRIGGMTVSIGVSLGVPAIGRTPQGLVDLASEALLDAQHAGGDRVVFKGEHSFAPLRTGAYKLPRAGRLARQA